MSFNIVLLEPEIPNNTGNIGRLCLATGCTLHLIKPLGFELSDSKLKRAGLDYWKFLDLRIYDSKEDFFSQFPNANFSFFSSHSANSYTDKKYNKDDFFVFGKESVGLPKQLLEEYHEYCFKIPLFSPHIRSLNVANSVGIVIYEGIRQLQLK